MQDDKTPTSCRINGIPNNELNQVNELNQAPQIAHYKPAPLYNEYLEDEKERKKQNRKFLRFVSALIILSMVGAPFLGLGFGIGARLFDNYFLPMLLDDSAERENFSFDNINPTIIASQNPLTRPNYVELVQLVEPSVVLITAHMPRGGNRNSFSFNFGAPSPTSAGSGIIMYETSTRIYIATNAHVVEGAQEVHVSIAGSDKIPALPVGRNSSADLAVIAVNKADAIQQGVTTVRIASFGDSDQMQVGQGVLAIGNSMGEGNTVTNGIISAIDREIFVQNRHLSEVLQTNAAINQGNSGGPLINLYGEVIGINTAKFSERLAEGMGYAIPSNVAMPILQQLMQEHTPGESRPMIGITVSTLTPYMLDEFASFYLRQEISPESLILPEQGVLIASVLPDGPAYRAGFMRYDIITAVNGRAIAEQDELIGMFTQMQAGNEVTLTIIRDGTTTYNIPVTLGLAIQTF